MAQAQVPAPRDDDDGYPARHAACPGHAGCQPVPDRRSRPEKRLDAKAGRWVRQAFEAVPDGPPLDPVGRTARADWLEESTDEQIGTELRRAVHDAARRGAPGFGIPAGSVAPLL